MTTPVFIVLGSNMDPARNLPWAAGLLADQIGIRRASHVYQSAALGPEGEPLDQEPYLNAAVLVEAGIDITPDILKYRLLRPIETSMGRVRSTDRFAARPIDLDIALFGSLVDDSLGIPDPGILTRAHVALPLTDLDPQFVHPVTGQTLAQIAAAFSGQPGIRRTGHLLRPG